MNRKEAMRINAQDDALRQLGFTLAECDKLRRISNTLRNWHELECGTGDGQVTRSIERDGDELDSKPYMRIQRSTPTKYQDLRYRIPDRETGARKRLAAIMNSVNCTHQNPLSAYIQGDPRGAALYIICPGDVPDGEDVHAFYHRGICVY